MSRVLQYRLPVLPALPTPRWTSGYPKIDELVHDGSSALDLATSY